MSEKLSAEEVQSLFKQVTDVMIGAVRSSATALISENEAHVRLQGSGTFVNIKGRRVILTCAHVTDAGGTDFGFFGSRRMIPGERDVVRAEKYDAAFINVAPEVWQREPHDATAIPVSCFADRHEPVENELFFMMGFAGENSHFAFESMQGTATCYCTQINKDVPSEERFFSLYWKPGKIEPTGGTDPELAKYIKTEDPRGFSGAAVWNTGFIRAYHEGRVWSPDDARITGLVTRWDMATESLVARRIEDVREWVSSAIDGL